jgi:hypothetical protein
MNRYVVLYLNAFHLSPSPPRKKPIMLSPPPLLQLDDSVFFGEQAAFMDQQTHVFHELSKAAATHARAVYASEQTLLATERCIPTSDPTSTCDPEGTDASRVSFGTHVHTNSFVKPGTSSVSKPSFVRSKTRASVPRKRKNTVSEYEVDRKRNIERNNAILTELGLIFGMTEKVAKKTKNARKVKSFDVLPGRASCRSVQRRQYKEWSSDDEDFKWNLPPLMSTNDPLFISP